VPFRRLAAQRGLIAAASTIAWVAPALADPEQVATETPYTGITYTTWEDSEVPARMHVVEIDLASNEIDLLATGTDQRGSTPTAFAAAVGAAVVINGDYFKPAGFVPVGLARGAAKTWSGTRDDETSGFVQFHRDVDGNQARISSPSEVVDSIGEETVGVVSGRPLIVRNGAAEDTFDCDDLQAILCQPAPRSAVALSEDRNTMWLVVVDGWQSESLGLTAAELAAFIEDLQVDDALLLDGGSASAMWLNGGLVSSPSDGAERPVANHIAIKHGVPADGLYLGHVFEGEIDGPPLTGALVTLDDNRSKTYDGTNVWSFAVRPRWTCATGTFDGYRSETECRHVGSDEDRYGSITLSPHSAFIDAGPGSEDAGAEVDAGEVSGADAGTNGGGTGGCGCGTTTETGRGGPAILGGLLAGVLLLRRRTRNR
jgi:MYXO-CTERM domain-containing protein